MAVYIDISSSEFGSSIKGNSLDNCITPVKRSSFADYFPRTKAAYKGFIAMDTFRSKMERMLKSAILAAGKLNDRYGELPPPSQPASPVFTSHSSKALDQMTKESAARDYCQDIKSAMLNGVDKTEWRAMNEMNESQEMYAQSNNYFTSAVKDAGIYAATLGVGKAVGTISKKLNIKTIRQFKNRVPKTGLSLTGKAQMLGDSTVNYTTKASFTMKNTSITLAEFDTVDHVAGKGIEKLVGRSADAFNCFDFEAKSKWGKNLNEIADIVTDFNPYIAFAKLAVNTGYNTLLGFQTRATANRMKEMEDKSNEAERTFNRNLKQTIYSDVESLSPAEVMGLINILRMDKLTQ